MTKATTDVRAKAKARKPARKGKRKPARAKPLQATPAEVKRSAPRKRARPPRSMPEDEKAARAEARRQREATELWIELYHAARQYHEGRAIMTPKEVIVALGGPIAFEDLTGMSGACQHKWVSDWATHGACLSNGYHLKVYLALTDLGYRQINPKLFGFKTWDQVRPIWMQRPAVPS